MHWTCPSLVPGSTEAELDSDDLDDDDDDDDDDSIDEGEEERGPSASGGQKGAETLDRLKRYMDQMDQELMGTNIGQSFTQKVRLELLICPFLHNSVSVYPAFHLLQWQGTLGASHFLFCD